MEVNTTSPGRPWVSPSARSNVFTPPAFGVAIGWIEHVVHALTAAVGRMVVLYGGRFIADGPPGEVMRSPVVAEIYLGIAADA